MTIAWVWFDKMKCVVCTLEPQEMYNYTFFAGKGCFSGCRYATLPLG